MSSAVRGVRAGDAYLDASEYHPRSRARPSSETTKERRRALSPRKSGEIMFLLGQRVRLVTIGKQSEGLLHPITPLPDGDSVSAPCRLAAARWAGLRGGGTTAESEASTAQLTLTTPPPIDIGHDARISMTRSSPRPARSGEEIGDL